MNFPDRLQPYPILPPNAGSRGARHRSLHGMEGQNCYEDLIVEDLYRPSPAAQVFPQVEFVNLVMRSVSLPLRFNLHLKRLLLQTSSATHSRRLGHGMQV